MEGSDLIQRIGSFEKLSIPKIEILLYYHFCFFNEPKYS